MKPYVYKCVHKETGEFYFGYRSQNKVQADLDLGHKYFTSSALVRPRFHEFHYSILAEFDDKVKAHEYEQSLIRECWDDPLLLNRAIFPKIKHNGSEKQSAKARQRMLTSNPMKLEENRIKASLRQKGRRASVETRDKMSKAHLGRKIPNRKKVDQSGALNPSAKTFVFLSPNGEYITVIAGLKKFCISNSLGYNSMLDLGNGKRSEYKGWTLVSKSRSKP